MICQRCLQRAATTGTRSSTSSALFSSTKSQTSRAFSHNVRSQSAVAPQANADADPSLTPPSSATPAPKKAGSPTTSKAPLSSVPAGTVLKGLNFFKNKADPVALEDSEYPAWLWKTLEKKDDGKQKADVEGDLFAKSKKQRQRAAKALRREALRNPDSLTPKVPLYEQSIDLPRGDGTPAGTQQAGAARKELTKSMRDNRRSKIKEANFLKGMN